MITSSGIGPDRISELHSLDDALLCTSRVASPPSAPTDQPIGSRRCIESRSATSTMLESAGSQRCWIAEPNVWLNDQSGQLSYARRWRARTSPARTAARLVDSDRIRHDLDVELEDERVVGVMADVYAETLPVGVEDVMRLEQLGDAGARSAGQEREEGRQILGARSLEWQHSVTEVICERERMCKRRVDGQSDPSNEAIGVKV